MGFLRMPGAFVHSIEIAIDKATTAAGFGFPTSQWPDVLAGDEALRLGIPQRPRLVGFGGGLPIREQGVLIGGIGVSGGSAGQDEACARAALAALGPVATQLRQVVGPGCGLAMSRSDDVKVSLLLLQASASGRWTN